MLRILLTGGAGFIGYHLTKRLLELDSETEITSVDNFNGSCDAQLKRDRLAELAALSASSRMSFHNLDITAPADLERLFAENAFTHVIHLAAKAGVRLAGDDPGRYVETNIRGFFHMAELSATHHVHKFLYASSSSVYGANASLPFREDDNCRSPMSLYAATKLADEALAAAYSYSHGLSSVGLRMFNVYGPWGRPDMAYYRWADALTSGGTIELRHSGEMYRDMTYVDDVVRAICLLMQISDPVPVHEVYNIGNRTPVRMLDLLEGLQSKLGIRSDGVVNVERNTDEPVQTCADTSKLRKAINFEPSTPLDQGLDAFVAWYVRYAEFTRESGNHAMIQSR